MEMQKIIELSNDYYFIISDGKIYTSEGCASDIRLGEEFFDLTTINEKPKGKWVTDSNYPDTVICNKCNSKYDVWWIDKGSNYCPNCGAEMEVE